MVSEKSDPPGHLKKIIYILLYLMNNSVKFICGDAHLNILCSSIHHFSCQLKEEQLAFYNPHFPLK